LYVFCRLLLLSRRLEWALPPLSKTVIFWESRISTQISKPLPRLLTSCTCMLHFADSSVSIHGIPHFWSSSWNFAVYFAQKPVQKSPYYGSIMVGDCAWIELPTYILGHERWWGWARRAYIPIVTS
jgi:hypothetical protein